METTIDGDVGIEEQGFLLEVKVPKSGQEERQQFRKELKVYEILSRHPLCSSLVQCFYNTTDGIFLEYMRGATLMVC